MKVRVVISDNESENKVVLQISFCNDTIICYTMNLALLFDIKPNILILSTSADKAFKKKIPLNNLLNRKTKNYWMEVWCSMKTFAIQSNFYNWMLLFKKFITDNKLGYWQLSFLQYTTFSLPYFIFIYIYLNVFKTIYSSITTWWLFIREWFQSCSRYYKQTEKK